MERSIQNSLYRFWSKPATIITLVYYTLGFLWIIFSDKLTNQFFSNPAQVQTIKGILYVLITGIFLFFLIERSNNMLQKTISERNLLEQKFIQAQKMEAVGHLIGKYIHNLRNQLMIIGGNIDLISLENPSDPHLSEIKNSIQDTRDILQSMLSFSRKTKPRSQKINVNKVIESQINLIRPILKNHTIWLIFEPDSQLPKISLSRNYLIQILSNLILNSRDAINEKYQNQKRSLINRPTITVQTKYLPKGNTKIPEKFKKNDPLWLIKVIDEGIGMTPEIQNKVFEPFFTTKLQGKGTGLGMAAVKSIIDQLGGSISIKSKYQVGTEITIVIPIMQQSNANP